MNKVLKFYSETCGPCKVMSNKLKHLPSEVEIQEIEVGIEANKELIDKYNIRTIPTVIIVNSKDEVVKEFKGIVPIEEIISAINE